MKHLLNFFIIVVIIFTSTIVNAQSGNGLFDDTSILEITLRGNLKDMMQDRSDDPKNYPIALIFKNADSSQQTLQIEVKTRGHFRKQKGVCDFPPLLLSFKNDEKLQSTIFKDQQRTKLVMPCSGDEYVLREWLAYKIYNLVTPESFRARLVKLTLEDDQTKKRTTGIYGILLEEETQMAKRNKSISVEKKMLPQQMERKTFLDLTVFQYLIANTDWSIQYLQNIKLIAADSSSVPHPVPYDFDHAGIVNVPYAKPAAELELNSVRLRRYRGFCITDMKLYQPSIDHFNEIKSAVYKLYEGNPLLEPKYIKSTLDYLDEFYETINNPKLLARAFGYPCNKSGTGNIVIQGMKDQ